MDNLKDFRTGDYVRFDHGSGKAHGKIEHINRNAEDVTMNGHTLKGSDGDHVALVQYYASKGDGYFEPRETRMIRRFSQMERVDPLMCRNAACPKVERRVVPMAVTLTKRDNIDGDGDLDQNLPTINGYASVFHSDGDPSGTTYQLGDGYFERIMPTAFDRALREKQDVRALFNHNPDIVLGRTTNGTARLNVDTTGLRYEIDPPNTQAAKDAVTLITRGDVNGSSFGFIPRKVSHTEENGMVYRDIHDADLLDVSPVTYPAYTGTTSGVRSVDPKDAEQALKELQDYRVQQDDAKEQAQKESDEAALIEAERIASEQRAAEEKLAAELRAKLAPIDDRIAEVEERAISPSDFKATPYADLEVSQESYTGSKSEIAKGILTEDPDNDQWEDMKRCFLIYAPGGDRGDPPQQVGAYKFPVAARVGGKLVVHLNQVHAAVAALNGARTPSAVPTDAKKTAFANCLKYLRKLGVKDEDLPKFKG